MMEKLEHIQRLNVIREAVEWLGTPFISEARVKGIGADCGEFLIGVYVNAGVLKPFKNPHLPRQWHLHASQEQYIARILPHMSEIFDFPRPGDVALFHVKQAYAHAGLVIEWPHRIIHCEYRGGVQWGDASRDALLIMEQRQFPPRFFSPWAKRPEEDAHTIGGYLQ